MGVLKLLTGGCFGILWILDIINIATGKLQPADGNGYGGENVSTSQQMTAADPFEELKKLNELKEAGILSETEFEKMKIECLAKM